MNRSNLLLLGISCAALGLLGCPPPPEDPDSGMDAGSPDATLGDATGSDAMSDTSVDDAATRDTSMLDVMTLDTGPVSERVMTESGEVVGETDDDLVIFRGIPYAAPPTGDQRWRRPEAFGPFAGGSRDATTYGAQCPQPDGEDLVGDEDCLFLNVWAPRASGARPVMVFIHGGAYLTGAGSLELYESSNIVHDGDVVVVTINYRLGALGFLNAEALAAESGDGGVGNYGIHDQIAALEWVQRNIAAFGGDPNQVTIFGESAGAISICSLLGSELADGLYHGAILESGGGCFGYHTPRDAYPGFPTMIERGAALLTNLGCADDEAGIACGRAASVSELVAAQPAEPPGFSPDLMGGIVWAPGIDDVLLTEDPFDRIMGASGVDVPVIIGTNLDEATAFTGSINVNVFNYRQRIAEYIGETNADAVVALYPVADFVNAKAAFNAFATDLLVSCTTEHFVATRSATGRSTHLYEFRQSLRGLLGLLGATHGSNSRFSSVSTFSTMPTRTSSRSATRYAAHGHLLRIPASLCSRPPGQRIPPHRRRLRCSRPPQASQRHGAADAARAFVD